jgi:hypothetical protein
MNPELERIVAKIAAITSNVLATTDMDSDFSARQIVDDLYRKGIDVRFQQHIIEGVLRATLEKE